MENETQNMDKDLQELVEAASQEEAQAAGTQGGQELFEGQSELIDAVNKYESEEGDESIGISFKTIIGGDILKSPLIQRQVLYIIFIVILMVTYTWNRYSSQDDIIEIDRLRKELADMKYKVLTQSSELMNTTRQSNIELMLKGTPDSILHTSVTPPYLLKYDDDKSKGGTIESLLDSIW